MIEAINYLFSKDDNKRIILAKIIACIAKQWEKDHSIIKQLSEAKLPIACTKIGDEEYSNEEIFKVIGAIEEMLKEDGSIDFLLEKLDNSTDTTLAITFVGWFGSRARMALPILITKYAVKRTRHGTWAREAILQIGSAEANIIQGIRKSIEDGDDEAFSELTNLAINAGMNSNPSLLDLLVSSAQHVNPHIREATAFYVGQVSPKTKRELMPILIKLKEDVEPSVQIEAIATLENMGKNSDS